MRPAVTGIMMLVRLLGVVQLLVGFCLWIGWIPTAVTLHIALGSVFVVALWLMAVLALFVLSTRGVALFALLWGGLLLWFGVAQTTLLVGSGHWAVRIAHLLIGVAALGLAESLGKAVKLHWSVRSSARSPTEPSGR